MRTTMIGWAFVLALGFAATTAGASDPAKREPFEFSLIQSEHGLTLHKELGLMPFTYSEDYHGAQTEVIFQISAKHDLFGTRFFMAYSQISFWQAYDRGNSAPFRETNYNPEIFYRFPDQPWGGGLFATTAGFEHESNGQRIPLSRSWNLLYLAPSYRGDQWLTYVKLRYRIPEDDKETPLSAEGDDNPDITDYLGYSDIHFYHTLFREHLLHLQIRGYIGTDKGNFSLNYSIPLPRSNGTYLWLRFFNGHGESMLDYDRHLTRVGIGLLFNR